MRMSADRAAQTPNAIALNSQHPCVTTTTTGDSSSSTAQPLRALLRILVRQKRLPAAVGDVVAPNQLHLIGLNLMVNVLNADLSRSHVAAADAKFLHPRQRQLTQVARLHSARHQRHRNVAAHSRQIPPYHRPVSTATGTNQAPPLRRHRHTAGCGRLESRAAPAPAASPRARRAPPDGSSCTGRSSRARTSRCRESPVSDRS
jgi:hypothetical protein